MANDESSQPEMNGPVGKQLQRAREKAGLSITDVANVQHLRSCIVQAIEDEDYSKVDTELFLKGYIRAYAKQVGLNEDQLIADLELELEPFRQKQEQEYEANPLVTIERRRTHKRRLGKLILLLVAVVLGGYLVFTFGLGGYAGISGQNTLVSEPEESSEIATEVDPSSIEPLTGDAIEERAAPDTSNASGTVSPDSSDRVAGVETILESEPEAELATPVVAESVEPALVEPGEPFAAVDTGILQITFTGDCWVQVRDATGDKLVNSLQRNGDRIDISGETPLNVVIGAVDAVGSIQFQGEAVHMADYPVTNNRSEFTLTI